VKVALFIGGMLLTVAVHHAGATALPISPETLVRDAAIAFEGTPYAYDIFPGTDGCIYTEIHIKVSRVYRGILPACIRMRHPGGRIGDDEHIENQSPTFVLGQPYLILGAIRNDGTLCAREGIAGVVPISTATIDTADAPSPYTTLVALLQERPAVAGGDVDVRSQASTWPVPDILPAGDLTLTTNGISARFTAVDRGEPLSYILDMDTLPTNVAPAEARTAIERAIAAWEDASSARFAYAGTQSLGKTAAGFSGNAPADILIQLHDNYGHITNAHTLGVGGRRTRSNLTLLPNGGMGGRLGTNEFDQMRHAYVILNHTSEALQNLMTLEEVLTHEVGHNLSVAHSSEDAEETDNQRKQAVMFFQAHEDGRGAALGTWDSNAVYQAYPPGNTTPYGYDRVMHVLMANPPYLAGSGINEVRIPMFDLQDPVAAVFLSANNANGVFTPAPDGTVFYAFTSLWSTDYVLDPATGAGYDWCHVRISDGTNMSPPVNVRVVSYLRDVATRDGIPDAWADTYSLGPAGNADGDPFTDRQEWLLDTDPTNDASGLFISVTQTNITWDARPYEVYELLSTTNIADGFTRDRNPITPTTQTGEAKIDPRKPEPWFFRLRYLP
jgi:hypothetical protein